MTPSGVRLVASVAADLLVCFLCDELQLAEVERRLVFRLLAWRLEFDELQPAASATKCGRITGVRLPAAPLVAVVRHVGLSWNPRAWPWSKLAKKKTGVAVRSTIEVYSEV